MIQSFAVKSTSAFFKVPKFSTTALVIESTPFGVSKVYAVKISKFASCSSYALNKLIELQAQCNQLVHSVQLQHG